MYCTDFSEFSCSNIANLPYVFDSLKLARQCIKIITKVSNHYYLLSVWQIVKEQINKIKKNKSPGPDEIFLWVLKDCKDVLGGQLSDIFQMSVKTYVPSL